MTTEIPVSKQTEAEHSRLYWFTQNILQSIKGIFVRHKVAALLFGVALLAPMYVWRAYYQPLCVRVWIVAPEILLVMACCAIVSALWRKRLCKASVVSGIVLVASVFVSWRCDFSALKYLASYERYSTLDLEELKVLPETDHERIQPLHSIRVLSREAMKEVEDTSEPDFVRLGNEYRWTMAIEPSYTFPKIFGSVKEILNVSGAATSPNFSGENRVPVSFRVGENLHLGKNSRISVIRSFGLFRFFSYSPGDVKYIKDDKGEWIQIVSLIKWRLSRFLFVWPEFGGVQVIHQGPDTPLQALKSVFSGEGTWIRPRDIAQHAYLREQNIVPYEVSRYIASSLRFQSGFFAPFPGYHKGDIRIPDLPGDVNAQPYAVYFRFSTNNVVDLRNKLYHYFALEPFHDTKQGLNTSMFLPADGMGKVMVYRHYKVNEALTGVSAIGPKVMESHKQYDWTRSKPAEHRPYIRFIDGKLRFFWLTTVVTYKDKTKNGHDYIAGSTPDATLTDATYKVVVWVNSQTPAAWPDELRNALGKVWASN